MKLLKKEAMTITHPQPPSGGSGMKSSQSPEKPKQDITSETKNSYALTVSTKQGEESVITGYPYITSFRILRYS